MLNCPVLDVAPLVIVGNVPSVVYRSVQPVGISTFTVNVPTNNCDGWSTTGAANCIKANVEVLLLACGVGFDVVDHSSPPSVVRA